jgi:hypothetical protein
LFDRTVAQAIVWYAASDIVTTGEHDFAAYPDPNLEVFTDALKAAERPYRVL